MLRTKMRNVLLASVGVAGVAMVIPAAHAASINDIVGSVGLNAVSFQDDDLEWEIDNTATPGTLNVGDQLRGIVVFPNESTSGTNLDGTTNDSLSAIFDITITSKVATGGTDNTTGGPQFDFTFGPSDNALDILDDGIDNDSIAANAALAFYRDTDDLDRADLIATGNRTDAINEITNGQFQWSAGFAGFGFEGWTANDGLDDLGAVNGVDDDTSVGDFNFFLSVLQSDIANIPVTNFATPFGMIGNGQIKGGDVGAPGPSANEGFFDATSNASVGFQEVSIPMPSTLALFGVGLLALGALGRRVAQ